MVLGMAKGKLLHFYMVLGKLFLILWGLYFYLYN